LSTISTSTSLYALAHHEPVYDDLDVVLVVLVEVQVHGELVQLAVDAHPRVSALCQVLEELAVLALAAPNHGRQHHEAGLLRELQHLFDHLLGGRGSHGEAADVAVGPPGAGVEEAQVVVDLRDRGDRGAGIVGRSLLVYGDCRGEAVYVIHVRFVHLAKELPRVGREALDVTPLSLGVDGVEGE
jgi:hypothetical protein